MARFVAGFVIGAATTLAGVAGLILMDSWVRADEASEVDEVDE